MSGKVQYIPDTIGAIKSYLASLQGFDIMALELIQNADDAKAEELSFDITDSGLVLWNSAPFSYCGDLESKCGFKRQDKKTCDFHSIIKIASGAKLKDSENIGRFGVGFVSSYQICDHPEIESARLKVKLNPLDANADVDESDHVKDTQFYFPWAKDSLSATRVELGASPLTDDDIKRIESDFKEVLKRSLLFLKNVKEVVLKKNGTELLRCRIERKPDERKPNETIITYSPQKKTEIWHLIHCDAESGANRLKEKYPILQNSEKAAKASLALRLDKDGFDKEDGYLYAYLPTQESTHLPLHINGEFFPETNRKALMWKGKHEKEWNELLVEAAASELAADPEALVQLLGQNRFWELVQKAKDLWDKHKSAFWSDAFWNEFQNTIPDSPVLKGQGDEFLKPQGSFFCPAWAKDEHIALISKLGMTLADKKISKKHKDILDDLGVKTIDLDLFMRCLNSEENEIIYSEKFTTLWEILEKLIPEDLKGTEQLKSLRVMLNAHDSPSTISDLVKLPEQIQPKDMREFLPKVDLASDKLSAYPKIFSLIEEFSIHYLAKHLEKEITENDESDGAPPFKTKKGVKFLYSAFSELYDKENHQEEVASVLADLPIWLVGENFVTAEDAIIPGDFNDPLAGFELMDESLFKNKEAKGFAIEIIGVRVQNIREYVLSILPKYFEEDRIDDDNFEALISELASHPNLVDKEETRSKLLELPLAPNQGGGRNPVSQTYRYSDELEVILGDEQSWWLDDSRLPQKNSVHSFLDGLGLLTEASHDHVLERIRSISKRNEEPDETDLKAMQVTFEYLEARLEDWKEDNSFETTFSELQSSSCFPSTNKTAGWYGAENLFSPRKKELFESQEKLIAIRLSEKTYGALGIQTEIPTNTIIEHLKHLAERGEACSNNIYLELNSRAKTEKELLSSELSDQDCIYIHDKDKYVSPHRVFSKETKLWKYAYDISNKYTTYEAFYLAIGVKEEPTPQDYFEIIKKISEEWEKDQKFSSKKSKEVLFECMNRLSKYHEDGEPLEDIIAELKKTASLINKKDSFGFPDDLLHNDSHWHAQYFDEDELSNCILHTKFKDRELCTAIGVGKLSERTTIEIHSKSGEKKGEPEIVNTIQERLLLIKRIFHEELEKFTRLEDCIHDLQASSHLSINTIAKISLAHDHEWESEPVETYAFYDDAKESLLITRPDDAKVKWAKIFHSLLTQLFYDESVGKIRNYVGHIYPLMDLEIEDADELLNDMNFPILQLESDSEVDISSHKVEEESASHAKDDSESKEAGKRASSSGKNDQDSQSAESAEGKQAGQTTDDTQRTESTEKNDDAQNENSGARQTSQATTNDQKTKEGQGEPGSSSGGSRQRKGQSRPNYKKNRDRRLRTYVLNNFGNSERTENSNSDDLRIEKIARAWVEDYEVKQGREIVSLFGSHPGYDLTSYDPETDKTMYIEVKGTRSELGKTGVSLTKRQFLNAQEEGEDYWLYIVERCDTEKPILHRIQNPAFKITEYFFDDGWLAVADNSEAEDKRKEFSVGRKVHHDNWGDGKIIGILSRGSTKVLQIQFEKENSPRHVPLNISDNSPLRLIED
jgi:hypothetical protein